MKRVLVVEDDEGTRELLQIILHRAGYTMNAAADGAEALEALRRGPLPDVVLLDLMMPVMDGWEFRRKQQRDSTFAHVPVVIISGAGDADLHAHGLEAAGSLNKPVDPDELLQLVERVVEGAPRR